MTMRRLLTGLLLTAPLLTAQADNFYRLEPALPTTVNITFNHPVFDFDGDGCLPSAGISRAGVQNGGLKASGSITGGCRDVSFLNTANTVHRHACIVSGGNTYCGHFYALYFLKDQATVFGGGHRHDWEHAAIWTTNGVVTHGGYSAHGDLINQPISTLQLQNGHLKIVYHKDGVTTHAMRFAGVNEYAENGYGQFVTPPIISWYSMFGDGVSNDTLRARLNAFNYGSANLPVRDSSFLNNLNTYRPAGYPEFTAASVEASR